MHQIAHAIPSNSQRGSTRIVAPLHSNRAVFGTFCSHKTCLGANGLGPGTDMRIAIRHGLSALSPRAGPVKVAVARLLARSVEQGHRCSNAYGPRSVHHQSRLDQALG